MQRIFNMDDAAPTASGAYEWLAQHLGVENFQRQVLFNAPIKFNIGIDNESDLVFKHNDTFYVVSFGLDDKVQTVSIATAEEVANLIDQRRDLLLKGESPKPVDGKATFTFEVIYFKDTGKYYTEGQFDLEVKLLEGGEPYMEEAYEHVRELRRLGTLPGLSAGCGREFTILVSHSDGSCRLIQALK